MLRFLDRADLRGGDLAVPAEDHGERQDAGAVAERRGELDRVEAADEDRESSCPARRRTAGPCRAGRSRCRRTAGPRSPYFSWSFTKIGISSRHGAHHVAQKFTTSTLPRHCSSDCGRPSRSGSCAAVSAASRAARASSGRGAPGVVARTRPRRGERRATRRRSAAHSRAPRQRRHCAARSKARTWSSTLAKRSAGWKPITRKPSISRPSRSKKMMPGGPNSRKRLSSAWCSAALAVTSAWIFDDVRQPLAHLRIAERVALHLLARDAPVGIEVEHHRAPARGRDGAVELAAGIDARERDAASAPDAAPRSPASGCSTSRPPESAPTRNAMPGDERDHADAFGEAVEAARAPAAADRSPAGRCR